MKSWLHINETLKGYFTKHKTNATLNGGNKVIPQLEKHQMMMTIAMSALKQMLFLLMDLWGIAKSLCAVPIVLYWLLFSINYLYYFLNRIIFQSGLPSILLLIQIHVLRQIKMFPLLPFQRALPLRMIQQKELSKVETLLKSQSSCPTWFLVWNAEAAVSWD